MLTKYETIKRVRAIWKSSTVTVTSKSNGHTWIETQSGQFHTLDSNGHPCCHKECNKLETLAYEQKLLK